MLDLVDIRHVMPTASSTPAAWAMPITTIADRFHEREREDRDNDRIGASTRDDGTFNGAFGTRYSLISADVVQSSEEVI